MEIINTNQIREERNQLNCTLVCVAYLILLLEQCPTKKKTNFIDYFQLRTSNGTTLKNMFSFEKIFH